MQCGHFILKSETSHGKLSLNKVFKIKVLWKACYGLLNSLFIYDIIISFDIWQAFWILEYTETWNIKNAKKERRMWLGTADREAEFVRIHERQKGLNGFVTEVTS